MRSGAERSSGTSTDTDGRIGGCVAQPSNCGGSGTGPPIGIPPERKMPFFPCVGGTDADVLEHPLIQCKQGLPLPLPLVKKEDVAPRAPQPRRNKREGGRCVGCGAFKKALFSKSFHGMFSIMSGA